MSVVASKLLDMSVALSDDVFAALVEPLRSELTAHCYRMLGSVHEAEDLVQEAFLRAWRSYDRFENRSSIRTWMYRIATNVCLTALDGRKRRPMPTGLGEPSSDPRGWLDLRPEVTWLEPMPDTVVWGAEPADPEVTVVSRKSIRLAFVAALQHLTPRQRVALILFEVLNWSAADIAELLDPSVAAVNSNLQPAGDPSTFRHRPRARPLADQQREDLLAAYADAFERYDIDRIVGLLAADAVWEMPPYAGWYQGSDAIGALISTHCPAEAPGDQRMIRVSANGQPGFALYMRGADGRHRPFQIQVLTLGPAGVSHVGTFFDTSLFTRFGLPAEL